MHEIDSCWNSPLASFPHPSKTIGLASTKRQYTYPWPSCFDISRGKQQIRAVASWILTEPQGILPPAQAQAGRTYPQVVHRVGPGFNERSRFRLLDEYKSYSGCKVCLSALPLDSWSVAITGSSYRFCRSDLPALYPDPPGCCYIASPRCLHAGLFFLCLCGEIKSRFSFSLASLSRTR